MVNEIAQPLIETVLGHLFVGFLPKAVLKYLIAHELAHIVTKKHGARFQGLVRMIHPEFKKSEKMVQEFEEALLNYPVS